MLQSFRVANHRSLRDEQELLLMPQRGGRAAVPVAAIYGANASGKSNVLDALRYMQTAVRDSYQRWSPTGGVDRDPFRLGGGAAGASSWYVVGVMIDGVRWTYGFEVDDKVVREEWLYCYPQQRRRLIFEREGETVRLGSTVDRARSIKGPLQYLLRENALLLSLAAQAGVDEALPMYGWLDQALLFADSSRDPVDTLVDYLLEHPDRQSELLRLIESADFGVTGMELLPRGSEDLAAAHAQRQEAGEAVRRSLSGDGTNTEAIQNLASANEAVLAALGSAAMPRLRLAHGPDQVLFEPADESDGTRSLLGILPEILEALDHGKVFVVDEIDTSLHPLLVSRLVELFRNPGSNPGGGQLLFTSHDSTLLGTNFGEPILERGEIWFTEKDADGASTLFPLTDFHPRKGENTERRYLAGSYGAIPSGSSDSLADERVRASEAREDAAS